MIDRILDRFGEWLWTPEGNLFVAGCAFVLMIWFLDGLVKGCM